MKTTIQVTGLVAGIQRGSQLPPNYGNLYVWVAEVSILRDRHPMLAEVLSGPEDRPTEADFLSAALTKALHKA